MTPEETRALIAEARQEESIQDKLGDGFSEGSEERAFYYEHRDRYKRLADALEARQLSENDREVLAKQLRDIGAVRKVDQDCSCQDCEGAAEWVNAPLSVVLDHFKTNVSDAEPTHLVCAWCPQPARGDAWHNDGKLHPSCGQIDHGQGWVPPYTPRAAVPDAATDELAKIKPLFENLSREYPNECNKRVKAEAERDAALARIAELEAEIKTRTEGFEEVMAGREASPEEWRLLGNLETAEARIAEAAKLHYRDTPSVGGDWCPEDHHKWPCPTAVALGLNEGENND